ncbi:MAG: L-serine ammonia-lyase, iron-sulfur-dependent subunit beta [Lachnospiraceae bacterium]|nr:L-serine ammonia-lyase, iron-sulfur-dependent subunit beta [Lachnospiraceae bacterium]
MTIFDIIGPVMVGPSSSHTAGAVKIGNIALKLMGEKIKTADIYFHGSFATTGKGHGTDRAIVAGLLGLSVDDRRIPDSFRLAKEAGMDIHFGRVDLGDEAHPNSVKLDLTGVHGRTLEVIASSIGGGRIQIDQLDGLVTGFSGDHPTLIVHNLDQPGHVAAVTSMLEHKSVNIASMKLSRSGRGQNAVMVIECDQEIPPEGIKWLVHQEGVKKVTYLSLSDHEETED